MEPLEGIQIGDANLYAVWVVHTPSPAWVALREVAAPTDGSALASAYWIWKRGAFEATNDGRVGYSAFGNLRVFAQTTEPAEASLFVGTSVGNSLPLDEFFGLRPESQLEWLAPLRSAGDWVLLAIVGVDPARNASVSIWASPGVRLKESGEAFFAQEEDFRGRASLAVQASTATTTTKVVAAAQRVETIESSLFGYFLSETTTGLVDMGYEAGSLKGEGENFYVFSGAPAARYRFKVDFQVDARNVPLYLLGADVRPP